MITIRYTSQQWRALLTALQTLIHDGSIVIANVVTLVVVREETAGEAAKEPVDK